MQQHMIQCFTPLLGGLYEDLQVLDNLFLTRKISEFSRAQYLFEFLFRGTQIFCIRVNVWVHFVFYAAGKVNKKAPKTGASCELLRFLADYFRVILV
jgi:hypothetical protein